MTEVSLELLFRQSEQILSELKKVRSEVADVRTHVLQVSEYSRRLERRLGEVDRRLTESGDDLALMLKGELVGRLGNFEITIDHRLEELGSRLTAIEEALPPSDDSGRRLT